MKVRVCFRLDDPHALSDQSLECRILALFARHNVPLCVAVIPFRWQAGENTLVGACSDNMPHIAESLRAGRIELAQHGYSHLPVMGTAGARPSEFVDVDEATQTKLITAGRRQLEEGFDTTVSGFVPPWNSYDETTTQVLGRASFLFISAGIEAPKYPRNTKPTGRPIVLPRTCQMRDLEAAIYQALRFRAASPAVVCVFHPDDFVEFRDSPEPGEPLPYLNLQKLETKLSWLRTIPEVLTCSIADLAEEALRSGRLVHATDTWWFRRIPHRFRYRIPQSILILSGSGTLLPGLISLN